MKLRSKQRVFVSNSSAPPARTERPKAARPTQTSDPTRRVRAQLRRRREPLRDDPGPITAPSRSRGSSRLPPRRRVAPQPPAPLTWASRLLPAAAVAAPPVGAARTGLRPPHPAPGGTKRLSPGASSGAESGGPGHTPGGSEPRGAARPTAPAAPPPGRPPASRGQLRLCSARALD